MDKSNGSPANQAEWRDNKKPSSDESSWLYQKTRLIVCSILYVLIFATILVATRELKPAAVGTGVVIFIVEITVSCHYWGPKAKRQEQRVRNTRRR